MRPSGKTHEKKLSDNHQKISTFNISRNSTHQELIEKQALFGDILSQLPAYIFSLAKIQHIYDTAIRHKLKIEQMNLFENDIDEISQNQNETIEHIKDRENYIDSKLKSYRTTSRDIKGKISRKKQEKIEIEKRRNLESLVMQNKLSISLNRRKSILPSLANQDMVFDISKLTNATDKRKREIGNLLASKNTRYKPISTKEKLNSDLLEREQLKMDIIQKNSELSTKIKTCSTALQLIQTSHELEHTAEETYSELIQGILCQSSTTIGSTPEIDDASIEKETELMLSYLDMFNELFAAGKYLEAAIQAGNSPKGFLRTFGILQRFNEATNLPDQQPAIMIFCQVLLDTVPAFGTLPHDISIVCVNVMREQGKFDLLSQSIFQNLVCFSNELGYLLYSQYPTNAKYLSLALHVFTAIKDRPMIASCLYSMQRPIALFNYIREFKDDEFVSFLLHEPTMDKALLLLSPTNNYQPVIDLANLLLLYIRNGLAILSVQIILSETDPFNFGNQLLYDFNADTGIWEEIAGELYNAGFTDIGERIFVSILTRNIIYKANDSYRSLLSYN
ncbi:Clathrin heavy chain linker domain-containing protein 1-like [Oopsacas minuta]|uniref:Clathrin heavy chain linker domain-containing protein 1-like n=1 Tax=Oopsacas minuta TaxID=111878 RepID=A0AAV7JUL6_9METZ|nr:Clathrin heavy chain linker domain-containing protein 1-like [Oopsacas minuta]